MKVKEMKQKINDLIQKKNLEMTAFEYYPKAFGCIVLRLENDECIYDFVVDRDAIYCNHQMLCDESYREREGKMPFDKLLECIENFL